MGKYLDRYFDLEYEVEDRLNDLEESILGYHECETRFNYLKNTINELLMNYEELCQDKDLNRK